MMLVYCIFLQLEFLSQKTRRYIFASKPRVKIKLIKFLRQKPNGKIELISKMLKWSKLAEVEFSRTSCPLTLKVLENVLSSARGRYCFLIG